MNILASDLDGTLIVDNTISDNDINAIKRLKESGGKFVISTGRTFNGVKNIIDNYDIQYDYLSLCNGGLIIDSNNNVIWDKWVPGHVLKSIVEEYYDNEDVIISGDNSNQINVVYKSGFYDNKLSNFNIPFERVDVEEIRSRDNDYRMLSMFTFSGDYEWAEKTKNYITNKYGEYVEAYRNQYFIDIVPKNCSKGLALLHILDIENQPKENLYTVGDSFNDVPMFNVTPNSYTFNRVENSLKSHANNLIDSVYEIVDSILV